MNWQPVASSLISHVAYDGERQILRVRFLRNSKEYAYHDVPPEAHEALMSAPSPGQHFHANIIGQYRTVRE